MVEETLVVAGPPKRVSVKLRMESDYRNDLIDVGYITKIDGEYYVEYPAGGTDLIEVSEDGKELHFAGSTYKKKTYEN